MNLSTPFSRGAWNISPPRSRGHGISPHREAGGMEYLPTAKRGAWDVPPARSGGDRRGGLLLSCLKINSGAHPIQPTHYEYQLFYWYN
jgi:hypothetical protein